MARLRSFVRPYLSMLIGTALTGTAVYLGIKHADTELAKNIITVLVTGFIAIMSFYFGERAGKRPEDK